MVQRLLSFREDIFKDYSQAGFERAFGMSFDSVGLGCVVEKVAWPGKACCSSQLVSVRRGRRLLHSGESPLQFPYV